MAPNVPPKPLGWFLGPRDAQVQLSCFLDFTCPFSFKQYKTLREMVYPKYASKGFCFIFYNMVQPWHPQSTTLHEASIAVGKDGGDEAFFKFADALFAAAESEFFDSVAFDAPRSQLIERLDKLASACGAAAPSAVKKAISMLEGTGLKNPGTGTTQDLKWYVKFSRQNGIHVSPTTMLNGMVFDSSSSWGLAEWVETLNPFLEP
mmetsp:Transcript_38212/g.107996  ORF Transcript_38212/g.107996 Transcript_38212/m.107996 type:complete len:205 (-) Transcript_38212:155-769(-)